MDGLILIDKPRGLTSHDVVLRLRRLLKGEKTGHCGTLDPEATGILLITVGKATRLFPLLSEHEKAYLGTIRLGFSTDTYDASGQPSSAERSEYPSEQDLKNAMKQFEGRIIQHVPPFSAKKFAGQPLYKLARAQKDVPSRIAEITVRRFSLLAYRPPFADVDVECSAGTYIRSLAHDLGRALGCGAHLSALQRTATGDCRLADCHRLDEIENWARNSQWDKFLEPLEKLLPGLGAIILTAEGEERARHGNRILAGHVRAPLPGGASSAPESQAVIRLFSGAGKLLALARHSAAENALFPFIVLAD